MDKLWYFSLIFVLFSLPAFGQSNELDDLKQELKILKERVEELETKAKEKPETQQEQEDKNSFDVYWKDGLRLETKDKNFTMKIGGRIFVDFGYVHEDKAIHNSANYGPMEDYGEFRTARLGMSGTLYGRIIFQAEFDFSGQVSFKNVYIGVNKLPLNGTLKIGHFKEPFSLETNISANDTTFMERSSPVAFSPKRNLGIAYFGYQFDKRCTYGLGLFRETGDTPPRISGDSGSYAFTGRLTFLPLYQDEGEKLLHIGGSYSYRNPIGDQVQYRSRPENHVGPRFVDTGTLSNIEGEHRAGIEGAIVFGPFSLQSELIYNWLRTEGGIRPSLQHFWGYYVYFSFFVTGEHRPYSQKSAKFYRIKVNKSAFIDEGGFGAIEVALRYSKLNLNDDIRGGRMDNITFGINWYLTSHAKVMLNYVYSDINSDNIADTPALSGFDQVDAHLFMTRFQLDF